MFIKKIGLFYHIILNWFKGFNYFHSHLCAIRTDKQIYKNYSALTAAKELSLPSIVPLR